MAKSRLVKPKSSCCKSRPRCKRCPVVCKRLSKQGFAIKRGDGIFVITPDLRKKQLKAARV
jgi:hypothetical protein